VTIDDDSGEQKLDRKVIREVERELLFWIAETNVRQALQKYTQVGSGGTRHNWKLTETARSW
jgi:hypothetical protein